MRATIQSLSDALDGAAAVTREGASGFAGYFTKNLVLI